ncbi:hypothetical protein JQ604_36160 [Bradyrhizobium jicamae]|uniref:hypothetical protein n=1 Tax=Bradyrhizobium jicamae TaxID=280332 RepID=UPI001BAE1D88|nr:hypothetical protein [Bradyrhizobium jicamae]MBR0757643.1 hypothetical protein [Bradyrhizobium jicamae]
MARLAFAGLAALAFAGAAVAEEDHGPVLVDLFAKTCALRPALPSELDRLASGLGFVNTAGPIKPDMERGPNIEIVYFAKLVQRGETVSINAYFTGPLDGPTVNCALNTVGVSPEALPGLVEKSLKVHQRTEKPADDNGRIVANWRFGATDDGDTLETWTRRDPPRSAAINLAYRGRKR